MPEYYIGSDVCCCDRLRVLCIGMRVWRALRCADVVGADMCMRMPVLCDWMDALWFGGVDVCCSDVVFARV